MAEIQQNNGGGGKGKSHQKKMTIRVDFTPMVDMNMLLITFFMLCTTMLKSQTLNIALPSNEKITNEQQASQADETLAVTLLLDSQRTPDGRVDSAVINGDKHAIPAVYYYFGKPGDGNGNFTGAANNLQKVDLIASDDKAVETSVRKILRERNKIVLKEIQALKDRFQKKEITQAQYDSLATDIRKNADKKTTPVVIIKSTDQATYGTLVQVLDEMQINSMPTYQIDNMTRADSVLLIDYQNLHHN